MTHYPHENIGHREVNRRKRHGILPVCPKCHKQVRGERVTFGSNTTHVHECCGLKSYAFKPLADQATLDLRVQAHELFDAMWKSAPKMQRKMERNRLYGVLADRLGVDRNEAHFSCMTHAELEKAIAELRSMSEVPL